MNKNSFKYLFCIGSLVALAQNSPLSDTLTIRNFDENFQKNYTDKAFIYEVIPPTRTAWDDFKEALARFLRDLFGIAGEGISGKTIELIMKIIAGIVILIVIYLIVKAIMNKEGNWIFGKSSDKKIIEYTESERNIHTIPFEKLIQEAIANNNKRLATRYYFLWLLKKLTDKQIIDWHLDKTNSDYSYEIRNHHLKNDFHYLTYLYDYIWYGEFEVTDEIFTKTRKSFETTFQSLH